MPQYNTKFDLDIDDLDVIETALRERKKELSLERLALQAGDGGAPDAERLAMLDESINATHDLPGRLHHQKIFYRPSVVKNAPYISG